MEAYFFAFIIMVGFVLLVMIALAVYMYRLDKSPEGQRLRREYQDEKRERDSKIVCPQCQTSGHVTTTHVTLKKGISGAKATGAILTGGLSLAATGLSQKDNATQATCSHCGSTWHF